VSFKLATNVLALGAVADFEALHCQASRNFDRSTKLDLTTEPAFLQNRCYRAFFFFAVSIVCMSNSVSEVLYFTLNVFSSSNLNLFSCFFMSFNL
jgi:hypothetical protein